MVRKLCHSQNHPNFHQQESKVPYKFAALPLFHLKLYCDGFLWCNFSPQWYQFFMGPVHLAETGAIRNSLAPVMSKSKIKFNIAIMHQNFGTRCSGQFIWGFSGQE